MRPSKLASGLDPAHQVSRLTPSPPARLLPRCQVPAVVRMAKAAVSSGKCVVIGLQSTGEARTAEAVQRSKAERSRQRQQQQQEGQEAGQGGEEKEGEDDELDDFVSGE